MVYHSVNLNNILHPCLWMPEIVNNGLLFCDSKIIYKKSPELYKVAFLSLFNITQEIKFQQCMNKLTTDHKHKITDVGLHLKVFRQLPMARDSLACSS
jgi:hypothetical protein